MSKTRIEELKEQIAELHKRWPAHSVPPAMMEQLDDLEEELHSEITKGGELDEACNAPQKSERPPGEKKASVTEGHALT